MANTDSAPGRSIVSSLGAWRDAVEELFPGFHAQRARDDVFEGYYQRRSVGQLSITELAGSRNVMLHGAMHPRAAANPRCCLIAQLAGGVEIHQSDRTATLGPGDVILVDGTRPVRFDYGDRYRQLAVQLPHNVLTGRLGDDLPSGEALPGGSPLTGVLRSLVVTLFENAGDLARSRDEHLRDSLINLLGAAARQDDADAGRFEAGELSVIRRLILANLDDPELTAASVAQRRGISIRTLHRIFARADVSVAEWILQQRLERCKADLANPQLRCDSIGAIAFKWGFNSFSHFSRAFRRRYGMSPRDWRTRS